MKTVSIISSLILAAGSLSAGLDIPSITALPGPNDFDYSATDTYSGGNPVAAEAAVFWSSGIANLIRTK